MKKLMFAASAALCAAVGFADVTSANVVGYHTIELKAQKQSMIGVSFTAAGNNEGISVQDLIPNASNQLTSAATAADADQLWYYDPNEFSGFVQLYLYNHTKDSSKLNYKKGKWVLSAAPADDTWGEYNEPSTKVLSPGMGLWLVRANSDSTKTLTVAGQVVVGQDGTCGVAIREGQTMIGNPFPTGFALNAVEAGVGTENVNWTNKHCVAAATAADADQIWWYDADEFSGFVQTFLYTHTKDSSKLNYKKNRWCLSAAPTDSSWGTINEPCIKVIPAGRAFWYVRLSEAKGGGAFTLNFDQPYTLGE